MGDYGFLGACVEAEREEAQREEKRRYFRHVLEGFRGG
jgi:hypothetical protein